MENVTVDISVLNSDGFSNYIGKADYRIRCGYRACLETLGIPLPDILIRKPSGPKPGQRIADAHRAYHSRMARFAPKPEAERASPINPEPSPGSLFNDVFGRSAD